MAALFSGIALISLLLSTYFLLQIIRPSTVSEVILTSFSLIAAHIVLVGYILSPLNSLTSVSVWALALFAAACLSALIAAFSLGRAPIRPSFRLEKVEFLKHTSRFEKILLWPIMVTVLAIGVAHCVVIVNSAPGNWDSMTYHLARVAYYIQHNSLDAFDANYWAQTVHPKNSAILLLFTYLVTGGNENLTQSVQFVAYWVSVWSVYGISRTIGNNRSRSMFAAMVSALLINWLMEAPTTQNDLIITAYIGTSLYFLLAFHDSHKYKHLVLSSLGVGLALGTKSAAILPLASLCLIALLLFSSSMRTKRFRALGVWGISVVGATVIFALPAGYVENYLEFGHPIAPAEVRSAHSFEGKSPGYVAEHGGKNMLRYALDFLSLDGIPSGVVSNHAQSLLRTIPKQMVERLNIYLSTDEATRSPFELYRLPSSNEDTASWGIFGFGLVWPVVFLTVLGFAKSPEVRALGLAAILFFVVQSFAGPYDPWRGRYFAACAVFAVPTVGFLIESRFRLVRIYLVLITLLGCASAVSAVIYKSNSPLITQIDETEYTISLFSLTREEQLTRNRILYTKPVVAFEKSVPPQATVAVFLRENSYEYPLFGKGLTRRIIPINSFRMGSLPIPAEADYLLYDRTYPDSLRTDLFLGEDWYLRKLKE